MSGTRAPGPIQFRAGTRRPTLRIAAAQPVVLAGDLGGSAEVHAATVRRAGARVVVFPELSLTGYELAAEAVTPTDSRLGPIIDACTVADAVALVGAPLLDAGGRYIGMLRVDRDGATVAYRKMSLGVDEARYFAAGGAPAVIEVDGWRLGLGICKDMKTESQVRCTLALGVDAYVAGVVHHADERAAQAARGQAIARWGGVYVAVASCADATGSGYDDPAGQSTVWALDGSVLARAANNPGERVAADLTLPVRG